MKIFSFVLLFAGAVGAADLKVGAGSSVITPKLGTPMAGYYSDRAAEGTHDDLLAKALVLDDGQTKVALIVCDLLTIPRSVVTQARAEIAKLGFDTNRVMLSATHTHTGPVLSEESTRETVQGGMEEIARTYRSELPVRIAASVKTALAKMQPCSVLAAVGREEHLSFNRRFHMKDGTVGWNPGKMNPNIVRPAGPIDPDVPVIFFQSVKGDAVATCVNFAMHLDTVGGQQYSADYPGALNELLARVKGREMLTLFSIGTAGDINHIDVTSREPQKGHGEAQRIGTILAGEVLKTYARLKQVDSGKIMATNAIVSLPLPPISETEVGEARQVVQRYGSKNEPAFLEKVKAFKVLDVAARQGRPQEVEVQVIALGPDLAWVALPGEIFVELGLAIKKQSPFKHTIIAELANGSIGYIPTRKAYEEGNYEVISARCASGSGEKLVETALNLLSALKTP